MSKKTNDETNNDPKIVRKGEVRCPHCKKPLELTERKIVVRAPVRGQYAYEFVPEKSRQKRLIED